MYIMHPHQRPCLTVFLFQENKSFGASYHLHSSSDVHEVVSRTRCISYIYINVLNSYENSAFGVFKRLLRKTSVQLHTTDNV
jgi:hypothetical protein